jgi:hypothetical protein
MITYIYKDGFAIGYVVGDIKILFATPIPARILTD